MAKKPFMTDPKYNGLSTEEMIREYDRDMLLWEQSQKLEAQNQIELEKLQLEKEQIEADRENAELIAEATKQAEKNRHYNEMILEKEKQMNKLDLELAKQSHAETMRCKKLCDELNVNYEELVEFNNKFEYGVNSYEDMQVAEKNLKKAKTLLEKYKNKNFIYNYEKQSDDSDEYDEDDIKNFGVYDLEDMIDEEKEKIEKVKGLKYYNFQLLVDFGLVIWIGWECLMYFILNEATASINRVLLSIGIFIIFNSICRQSIKTQINTKVQEHTSKINKLKKEKDKKLNLAKKVQKESIKDIERKIEQFNKVIENGYKQNEDYKEKLYDKFLNFRIENYNEDMENLIKKLNLGNIMGLDRKYESKNKPIDELKSNNGTIKDYTNFIRKILGEND